MYNDKGQFEPTDGQDYKMMTEKELEKQIQEIEDLENPVELPKDMYGDEFDDIVIGEAE